MFELSLSHVSQTSDWLEGYSEKSSSFSSVNNNYWWNVQ